jgi:DNA-binding NarL/FixJ family response regulator
MADPVEPATSVTRVFLLDDHAAVRRGVADVLDTEPDIEVVGEASTAAEALASVPALAPHVAVLDVRLPDGDGVMVCRELRSRAPQVHCMLLTSMAEEHALLAAVLAGAAAYQLKQIRATALIEAIRAVAAGRSTPDQQLRAAAAARALSAPGAAAPAKQLSEQEHTALALIVEGATNRDIADRMTLPEDAVRGLVSDLCAKLDLQRLISGVAVASDLPVGD